MPGGVPIGHGLLDQPGLGVMLRDQLWPGFDDFWEACFQSGGDALVVLLTGAFQQRLVGGILDERVLEAVGRPRRNPLLVKKFRAHELSKTILQKIFVPRRDSA